MTSSHGAVQGAKIDAIFRTSPYAFKREADGSLVASLVSGMTKLPYTLYCSEEKDGQVYAKKAGKSPPFLFKCRFKFYFLTL